MSKPKKPRTPRGPAAFNDPTPRPRGRPPLLTRELQAQLCQYVQAGNWLESAAAFVGVGSPTVREWMRRGAREKAGKYVEFRAAVEKATAASELGHLANITTSAKGRPAEVDKETGAVVRRELSPDWKASAYYLEKRFPKKYGPQLRIVDDEQAQFLARLEAGLPPELFERVLAIGVGEDGEGEASAGPGPA